GRGTLGPVDRARPRDARDGARGEDGGPRPEPAARPFRTELAPDPGACPRVRGSRRGRPPAVVQRALLRGAAAPPVARRRRKGRPGAGQDLLRAGDRGQPDGARRPASGAGGRSGRRGAARSDAARRLRAQELLRLLPLHAGRGHGGRAGRRLRDHRLTTMRTTPSRHPRHPRRETTTRAVASIERYYRGGYTSVEPSVYCSTHEYE